MEMICCLLLRRHDQENCCNLLRHPVLTWTQQCTKVTKMSKNIFRALYLYVLTLKNLGSVCYHLILWFKAPLCPLKRFQVSPLPHPTKRTVTSSGSFHAVPLKAFGTHFFHPSALPSPLHLPIIVSYISDDFAASTAHLILPLCLRCPRRLGRIPRAVASINQHLLNSDDVVSCCLDLGAPSMSFRINGQPVQGMFEDFNTDGFFFPVVSFSAGVK